MPQHSRALCLFRRLPAAPLLATLLAQVAACDRQPLGGRATGAEAAPDTNPAFLVAAREPGDPLPFLTLGQRALFERGRGVFQTEFTPATGLGPLFNNTACSQCHEDPVVGAGGEEVETHQAAFHYGACDDLSAIGGPVIQDSVTAALHTALGIGKEPPLPEATGTAHRTTPSLLGFGLLLAPPAPLPRTVVERRGGFVFLGLGCASCHVPVLVTGPNRVSALSLKIVQPYSDLLLHDLGPDLADICLARARPAEFRTEPLMGLRFKTAYLHDGRAASIDEAIQAHGGEAARARGRFLRLSPADREAQEPSLQGNPHYRDPGRQQLLRHVRGAACGRL